MLRFIIYIFCLYILTACGSVEIDCMGWNFGGNSTGQDPGICFQFAPAVTSVSRKMSLVKNISVGIGIEGCIEEDYNGGPLKIRSQLQREAFVNFDIYSEAKRLLGERIYTGNPDSWNSPVDCTDCVLKTPSHISATTANGLVDLGAEFRIFVYAPNPLPEVYTRENRNFFDAIVTMESTDSPIRKILMDGKKCSANTSTDPTDWVEIDANDNIVPIYGAEVT